MELKDFKTWAQAEKWLAKHGYGITQIAIAKEAWESSNTTSAEVTVAVVKEPEVVAPASKTKIEVKPIKPKG
jgi:hypothetical protein